MRCVLLRQGIKRVSIDFTHRFSWKSLVVGEETSMRSSVPAPASNTGQTRRGNDSRTKKPKASTCKIMHVLWAFLTSNRAFYCSIPRYDVSAMNSARTRRPPAQQGAHPRESVNVYEVCTSMYTRPQRWEHDHETLSEAERNTPLRTSPARRARL